MLRYLRAQATQPAGTAGRGVTCDRTKPWTTHRAAAGPAGDGVTSLTSPHAFVQELDKSVGAWLRILRGATSSIMGLGAVRAHPRRRGGAGRRQLEELE